MKKTAGGSTVLYHYDYDGNLISETDGAGNPIRDYVHLNGEPAAMRLYGSNAGWYYFLNDHLGTPQKIVNASGTLVWEAGYMPFGEARVLVADIENNQRFPGQYYDSETGLHYNYHRYYDPDTGRYLTPDPIGLDGGMNLYVYVDGNPVNFVDPEGLTGPAGGAFAIIGWGIALSEPTPIGEIIMGILTAAKTGSAVMNMMENSEGGNGSCPTPGGGNLSGTPNPDDDLTDKPGKIADKHGLSRKEINDAIHKVKESMHRGGPKRNPDVWVNVRTGEVYPKTSGGGVGDSIGNIFDYLH